MNNIKKANNQKTHEYASFYDMVYGYKGENGSYMGGILTGVRGFMHNPFGINDQFNQRLHDRGVGYLVKLLKNKNAAKEVNSQYGSQPVIRSLKTLNESQLISWQAFNSKALGILAETCFNYYPNQDQKLLLGILTNFGTINESIKISCGKRERLQVVNM